MKEKKESPTKSLTYQAIFLGFTLAILSCDAILILLSGLRKGVFKKEVLSKKSKLGFDFKIIVK